MTTLGTEKSSCCQEVAFMEVLGVYYDDHIMLKWPLPLWRGGHCRDFKTEVNVWTAHRDIQKWLLWRGGQRWSSDCT